MAARTDAEHFARERKREERETQELPETEAAEVADVFRTYGLPEETVTAEVSAIRSDRQRWVDFMVRFELGLTEPDPHRAQQSALTIALAYVAGGVVPLAPYLLWRSVQAALLGSVLVTVLALFVFGLIKGRLTTNRAARSGWQTVLVGGVAAAAAFTIARMIGSFHARDAHSPSLFVELSGLWRSLAEQAGQAWPHVRKLQQIFIGEIDPRAVREADERCNCTF